MNQAWQIAEEKGIAPSQLALTWLLAQGQDLVPLPGTQNRRYLEESVAAADISLSPSEKERLKAVAPKGVAIGNRYPDMSAVNR